MRSTELITRSDTVTAAAIDWIGQATQPFFLVMLAVDPHWPYQPPERFDRYARPANANEREASTMAKSPPRMTR